MKSLGVKMRNTATLVCAVFAALLVYLPVSPATAQKFPPPVPWDPSDSCPWDTTGVFNETTGAYEGDGVVVSQYNLDGQWNPDGYALSDVFACWYVMNGGFGYPAAPGSSEGVYIEVSLALFPRCDIDGDGVVSFGEVLDISRNIGDCATTCNYHSQCGPNEYCAGEGCGDLTCDPLLPDGVCTPIPDIATCASAPIAPTCGCDYNFYLNECELAAAGVRYQSAGLCTPISCTSDADCPCGQSCVGEMAMQCLPN